MSSFKSFLLTGFVTLTLYSAVPAVAQHIPVVFKRQTVADGLPGNSVLSFFQDRAGFIWIGTESGHVQYDGYDVRTLRSDLDDPTTLSSHGVQSLLEDSQGRFWIGTMNAGLNRLERESGLIDQIPIDASGTTGPSDVDIMALIELPDHDILIGTSRGVDRFDGEKYTPLSGRR